MVQVGQQAPMFEANALLGSGFERVSFVHGLLKIGEVSYPDHYTVLFFYPMDFTFVCPTEIIAFSDRIDAFEAIKCKVVACSVDSEFAHLAWTQRPRQEGGLGEIRYPILADVQRRIADAYGVLLDEGVAARGLFVIDPQGVLQAMMINNLSVGRSVDEVLRLVQAYQFTAEHGEVCPANWRPGEATIMPEPDRAQSFFAQQAVSAGA